MKMNLRNIDEEIINKQTTHCIVCLNKYAHTLISFINSNTIEGERRKEIFMNIIHEIRTPLNGIIGFAELLKGNSNTEVSEMADQILLSANRLLNTWDNLQYFIDYELGEISTEIKDYNFLDLFSTVIEDFKRAQTDKIVDIDFEADNIRSGDLIKTDKEIFKRIFINLFENSVKFSNAIKIRIRCSSSSLGEKEYYNISIEDDGIGIPSELIVSAFEDFNQLSNGLNRKYEGLGIGLSLVKRLLNLLGGAIRMKSELNRGTNIEIMLPSRNYSKYK